MFLPQIFLWPVRDNKHLDQYDSSGSGIQHLAGKRCLENGYQIGRPKDLIVDVGVVELS